ILEDLGRVASRASNTELRSILGCFLFSEDDVFKRIGVLSGGERNRYALARMLMVPSNFLLLDEPTNHLDMRAKDVLLTALEEFQGTVVFVSHDRYFLDKLATRVFEVGGGEVHVFPGNYEEYLFRKANAVPPPANARPALSPPEGAARREPARREQAAAVAEAPAPAPAADRNRRLNPIKLRQMKERQRTIEDEITRLEVEIADFEQALSNYQSAQQSIDISELLESRRTDMKNLMSEWEEVSEIIEANR
ncbi:MAG: ATP-binding cassette domain-containing protein, partial [Acidobacteriota bacterium]